MTAHYGEPAHGWTSSPNRPRQTRRCIRSTSPPRSTGSPPTTRSSSPTSARPCIWAARYLHMNGRRRLHRLVQPRLDGQRPAAGDRRAGRAPGPPGRHALRRRRAGDAARRPDHAAPEAAAGEDRRVQQRRAALRRARDEGRRASSTSAPTCDNPDFAAVAEAVGLHGQRVEHAGDLDDALRDGVRPRRPGAGRRPSPTGRSCRCRRRSPRAGQGLHAVRDPDRSCPVAATRSSNWPRRTCATSTPNQRLLNARTLAICSPGRPAAVSVRRMHGPRRSPRRTTPAALALSVRPDQADLVSPVVKSLAEAYVFADLAWPRLVYDDDRLVGFVMAFLDYAVGRQPRRPAVRPLAAEHRRRRPGQRLRPVRRRGRLRGDPRPRRHPRICPPGNLAPEVRRSST